MTDCTTHDPGINFWKGPMDRYKELLDLIQLRQIRAHYLLDYSI